MPPKTAPIHSNAYATHIPVLIAMGQLAPIQRVLELGSGLYSTPTFLNRSVFPELTQLHSFENDPSWAEKVVQAAGQDPRLALRVVNGPIADSVSGVEMGSYDLVLIDDSVTAERRAETIAAVASAPALAALVLIHDIEEPAYRRASKTFPHGYVFRAFTPQTGVFWVGTSPRRRDLASLGSILMKHAPATAPDDVNQWLRFLRP